MLEEAMQVGTGLGSRITNLETLIPRLIDKKVVFRPAKETEVNDWVGFRTDYIDLGLDQIDIALREDKELDYEKAENNIYYHISKKKEDGSQTKIPKLRYYLLKGLHANKENSNLENMILKKDGFKDFSPEDYKEFISEIKSKGIKVQEQTILKWLTGEVIAPRNWENFKLLGEINPKFNDIHRSIYNTLQCEGDMGFHTDYLYYTRLRRTAQKSIMKKLKSKKYLNKKQPENLEPKKGRYPIKSFNFTDEIDSIVERFMQQIDTDLTFVKVSYINQIPKPKKKRNKKKAKNTQEREHHLVRQGFVSPRDVYKLRDQDNPTQIRDELYLLEQALYDGLTRYIQHRENIRTTKSEGIFDTMINQYIFSRKIAESETNVDNFNHNIDALIFNEKQRMKNKNQKIPKKYNINRKTELIKYARTEFENFENDLKLGYLDNKILKLEPGTMQKLFDLVNKYRAMTPIEYTFLDMADSSYQHNLKIIKILKEKNQLKKKQLEKKMEKVEGIKEIIQDLEEKLEKNYGIKPQKKYLFLDYFASKMTSQNDEGAFYQATIVENGIVKNTPLLKKFKNSYEKQGMKFFQDFEVGEVFNKLGIYSALNLFDRQLNFFR
ncbi:hypothetical protein HOD20_02885 [archaeon]|nr:hypothetical protein [archaeon]MBT4646698.1 hypothetical protein [archaeon]MBT6821852.1 hypothetical protein [archaeon]MBT7392262.1 hypothetical protein [archaeon]